MSYDAPPLDMDKMLENSTSAPIISMVQEEYLPDYDDSSQIRPIREVIKPTYGVVYSEQADNSRAVASCRIEGALASEAPEFKSKLTKAELE